jgi:iron(III) transport system substrate-binding protein
MLKSVFTRLGLVALAFGALASVGHATELNVYSARQEALIRPQLDLFTAQTGIKVNLITAGDDALIERLKNEGRNSPADVLLTADAGRMGRALDQGLLLAVRSATLERLMPAELRDPDGQWFGLSLRARPIFYNRTKVKPEELSTYEALVDPRWKGKILVRSSTHIYNQSLLASIIAHKGADEAEKWARGIAANLARKPQGRDTDQLVALAAGEGDVAITNTYYFARLLASEAPGERATAEKIGLFWPNQGDRGTHVNVSTGAVATHAPNRDNAVRFLEYLAGDDAQRVYAEVVQEFPIRPGIAPSSVVAQLGRFKADALPLRALTLHNAEAVRIFDRVGWR